MWVLEAYQDGSMLLALAKFAFEPPSPTTVELPDYGLSPSWHDSHTISQIKEGLAGAFAVHFGQGIATESPNLAVNPPCCWCYHVFCRWFCKLPHSVHPPPTWPAFKSSSCSRASVRGVWGPCSPVRCPRPMCLSFSCSSRQVKYDGVS